MKSLEMFLLEKRGILYMFYLLFMNKKWDIYSWLLFLFYFIESESLKYNFKVFIKKLCFDIIKFLLFYIMK